MDKILKGNEDEEKIDYVKDQYDGTGHPDPKFRNIKFRVVTEGGQNVIVIEGGLSDGKDAKPNENLEIMELVIRAVDQIVKKNCAFKAVFVKRGTLDQVETGTLRVDQIEGFDWSSCEWPNVACSGGECKPSCDGLPLETPKATPKPTQTPSPNTNKNANSNANSNRLVNS